METRALPFPTAVSPAISGSFVDETGHLIGVSNKWASLPIYSASIRRGTYEPMKGEASVRNLMVEYRNYETAVTCCRRLEYQATQKILGVNRQTEFIVVGDRRLTSHAGNRPSTEHFDLHQSGAAFYLVLYLCYLGPKCVFSVCLRRCSLSPRPLVTVAYSSNAASGSAAW